MSLRSPHRRPTHPGAILREDVLPALQMSQTDLAEHLGVSRMTVSELLHERRALSPELAVRLGGLLGTTPESWVQMQMAVDLWEARQSDDGSVRPLRPFQRTIVRGVYTTDAAPAFAARRRRKR